MATITKRGRELRTALNTAGVNCTQDQYSEMAYTLSLISRHAKTWRRICEMECGDGIHSGEWVNQHWQWLEKRSTQVSYRLEFLASFLPSSVELELNGDPRGYVVALWVTDELGVSRRVGVE
jgi:hypothetical protein